MLVSGIGSANGNMGGGNKNDGYANYYNAIQGVPKIIIETEIVNPSFYIIEVGDIVAMDHTNQIAAPFGESFNGKQFFGDIYYTKYRKYENTNEGNIMAITQAGFKKGSTSYTPSTNVDINIGYGKKL